MTPEQPVRTPVFQIALLFLAGLCAAGQFAKISIVFSEVRALYPEAGVEAGFLVSLLSLIGIVFGLFAGLVVARVGFRRLLLAALLAGALISLYQSSLPPLWLMLLSRVVEGIAHLIIVVAAPTLISVVSARHHQPIVMTLWSTIFGVTFALTAWLGLPLVAAFGVPALFQAHAGLLVIVAALLFFALPREEPVRAPAGGLTLKTILRRHAEVYTSPVLAAPAAGFVFYTLTYVSLLTLMPDFVDPAWRGVIVGVLPLASIAASLMSGATLLRRYSAISVAIAGYILGVVVSAAFLVLPGNPLLAIALFAALGLMQSASFAAIPELMKDAGDQALANGAIAQAGNFGNTLGTPVLLAFASSGGFAAMIGLVGLLHVAGALVHAGLRKKRIRAA